MHASILWLRELATTLFARPDQRMLELGADGEILVARIRALLSALVLLLPLLGSIGGTRTDEILIGISAGIFINIMAQIWLALAADRRRHRWLPYATGTYDITTTTGVLALLAFLDPVAGLNSIVVWCFYLFAIAVTALRNDGRLTLYAGALATLQYAIFGWIVLSTAPPERLISIDYGVASITTQGERLLLMLMMTLLTATIVYRMQRLIQISGTDGLTGLPNRTWLMQQAPHLLDAVEADGGSLTLALLDLDDFKRINDDIGNLAGDRAIRHVVSTMSSVLQDEERLVRLSGQEFVVLLYCPIGSAWERLDRLRRDMNQSPFSADERNHDPQYITFSGGLAAFPQDGGDLAAILNHADRRLRQAKREGRNRLVARD